MGTVISEYIGVVVCCKNMNLESPNFVQVSELFSCPPKTICQHDPEMLTCRIWIRGGLLNEMGYLFVALKALVALQAFILKAWQGFNGSSVNKKNPQSAGEFSGRLSHGVWTSLLHVETPFCSCLSSSALDFATADFCTGRIIGDLV